MIHYLYRRSYLYTNVLAVFSYIEASCSSQMSESIFFLVTASGSIIKHPT